MNSYELTDKSSYEKMLDELKDSDKERLQYARARWSFLRKNKDFRELVDLFNETKLKASSSEEFGVAFEQVIPDIENDISLKWGLYIDIAQPDLSFEELVEKEFRKLSCFDVYGKGIENGELPLWAIYNEAADRVVISVGERVALGFCKSFSKETCPDCIRSLSPICVIEDKEYFDKTKGLLVRLNLNHNKKNLMKSFKNLMMIVEKDYLSSVHKTGPHFTKKTRERHAYDLYDTYLEVYDLKEQKGLTYKDIAIEVFPDNFKIDPPGAKEKIRQYYEEAKRLIENAVHF